MEKSKSILLILIMTSMVGFVYYNIDLQSQIRRLPSSLITWNDSPKVGK